MSNFQKINNKIIWCPNCDNPMDCKDKKCANCGYIISNSKKHKSKKSKFIKSLKEF